MGLNHCWLLYWLYSWLCLSRPTYCHSGHNHVHPLRLGGQRIYNYLDARNTKQLWERAQLDPEEQNKPRAPIMQRFLQSKWSPVTPLSDEQYENILREKILQVEAEIALVDDRIEEFRKKALEQAAEKLKEPPNPKPIEEKK